MTRKSCVLGVYFGHNASVALAENGEVTFALSEERVRRIKNYTGFPSQAYAVLLKERLSGDPSRIDLAVFPSEGNQEYEFFLHRGSFPDGRYFDYYRKGEMPAVPEAYRSATPAAMEAYIADDLCRIAQINADRELTTVSRCYFANQLGIPPERFRFIHHHAAHAYSACFHLPAEREYLVFTLDGSGDNLCATVNRVHRGTLELLSRNLRYASLGRFYREVTAFLGFRPDEHEFKVMGLAPYAEPHAAAEVYRKFAPLLWLNAELQFESRFPMEFMRFFLLENCVYDRFDAVAAAAQQFLEDRILEWIQAWIERTGIHAIALAGGVFVNVKANQRVCELEAVDDVVVVPSASDESTAIGCCYHGCRLLHPPEEILPIRDLNLGVSYAPDALEQHLESAAGDFDVERVPGIERRTAELLDAGEVVGWFTGRSEWGLRALGYRSILADPRRTSAVRTINQLVKCRDFWMPFAPSILEEDAALYLDSPSVPFAPYMAMAFRATPRAREELAAAVHPYDGTLRPHLVRRSWNPRFHEMISHFKARTGVAGVLNTSLNLHGSPNAMSPDDVLDLLKRSGLKYAVLEDWLVSKRSGWRKQEGA